MYAPLPFTLPSKSLSLSNATKGGFRKANRDPHIIQQIVYTVADIYIAL